MPQINPPIKISIYNAGETASHVAGDLDALTRVRNTSYITPGLINFVKPAGSSNGRDYFGVLEKRFVRIEHRKHSDELIERNNRVFLESVIGELERTLKNANYFGNK